jgi:hypothetical protein
MIDCDQLGAGLVRADSALATSSSETFAVSSIDVSVVGVLICYRIASFWLGS